MGLFNNNNNNQAGSGLFGLDQASIPAVQVDMQPLMRLVYIWMVAGLLTSAFISFFVSTSEALVIAIASNPILFFGLIIVQFGLVMGISWGINRISPAVAGVLFFIYAASMGIFLGIIFFAYIAQGQSMAIVNAFLTTAGLFGVMSVIGYTTKVDLTKFGAFFMMALIGLVIAIVVNMFLGSSMLDLIISIVGVLIFTGLTAYDTQRIKKMAQMAAYNQDTDTNARLAIMGALTLYLDFINLFLFLLRLFGGGRD